MNVLVLGGTDLTLAMVRQMCSDDIPPVGVVGLGKSFAISYEKSGVRNVRYADLDNWCSDHSIAYRHYEDANTISKFAAELNADFCLVAGWFHMVPRRVRDLFSAGCAGIHASLLPKLRGQAPLNWAIISGCEETGVSLFELSDGVDDGLLYGQGRIQLNARTTISELLHDAEMAALKLVSECLPRIADRTIELKEQVGTPSWALRRTPDDGAIDWNCTANKIDRLIRAVSEPYLGAFTEFEGNRIVIWEAKIAHSDLVIHGQPGQIARIPGVQNPVVVSGSGAIEILRATDSAGSDVTGLLLKSGHKRFSGSCRG